MGRTRRAQPSCLLAQPGVRIAQGPRDQFGCQRIQPVKSAKDSTEAQFYVSLVPGPARNAQVADVKFIRGDEKLKVLGAGLKTADFSFAFPDDTTTKVIRRGTLFCTPGTGVCSFIMLTPESIASVE